MIVKMPSPGLSMSSDENKNGYIMMMMAMDAYSNSEVCSIKLSKEERKLKWIQIKNAEHVA